MPGHTVTRTWQHNPTLDAPPRYRRACSYDAFIPTPLADLRVHLEGTDAGLVSEAESAIRELNSAGHPALATLGHLLLRTEAMASSKIEGMQTGVRELARAETTLQSGGKPGRTAQEVLANIHAMELALREAAAAKPFTTQQIAAIHRRLMEHAPNGARIAGTFRDTQNWIGGNDYNPCGAAFVPPPPQDVPGLLDDLAVAINDDVLPPVVQAALVHAQFETIHPFADGNGRTGRALIHVVFKRRGLAPRYVPPISVVLANAKDRYIAGLQSFHTEHIAGWLEQFAAAALRAARLAARYLNEVQALIATWRGKLNALPSAPRADAAAWAVIEALPAHPMIDARGAGTAIGRAKPRVYEALEQLEAAGVLIPVSRAQRNRIWEAAGLIDLLEGLEAGEMPDASSSADA